MKFNSIFILYSIILGFIVGLLSALFLTIVNFLIHGVWVLIPTQFDLPVYYPLIVGVIGGVLVGLFQKYVGAYPKTMHETIHEFKTTKAVAYRHQLSRNFFSAIIVLAFGASLGPEAALASILGGLITLIGDQMKITIAKREQLLDMTIGAMIAAIFHAPFVGLTEPLEAELANGTFKVKARKNVLYSITSFSGFLGFAMVQKLFPKEALFKIRIAELNWQPAVLWFLLPALLIGIIFGYTFLFLEQLSDKIAAKIQKPVFLAVTAGVLIGILGMISPYFLFSGEHELLNLSNAYTNLSVGFLVLLASGKAVLTNVCFAFGWRGGKIFPVIFASAAVGFAFANMFPYMPGLLVGTIVAAGVTTVLKQPLVTAALLLFLLPLQFFPIILLVCLLAHKFQQFAEQRYQLFTANYS